MKLKNRRFDISDEQDKQYEYGSSEVGVKHPNNTSHMKIFDNGNVEIFAGDMAGVAINSKYNTVNTYGFGFNVQTQYTNLNTNPYGLRWNGYIVNPTLYMLSKRNMESGGDLQLMGQVRYWVEETENESAHWAYKSVAINPFIEMSVDDEYNKLLSELGIPV